MPEKEKPLQRLRRKTTKENLWIYLLTLLEERPMYAYELKKSVKDRFGFEVGRASSYVILYKLKNKGYVKTEWRKEGRNRKYYLLTEKGRRLLEKGRKYLRELENLVCE